MFYFQDVVAALSAFWARHGCAVITPYDVEKGAGTSNPNTLLRALGPEPFSAAYIEPCRRPKDGRYGTNPNRLQHYFQYQVILKPSPDTIVDLYLDSLQAIGLDTPQHDLRFVHDDWENPTLGAWGLGWEIWLDGMEVSQFTYFQAAAGLSLPSISGEITYGIERLAMVLQGVHSVYDLKWNDVVTYGDLFFQDEVQWSRYNFEAQDDAMWMRHFEDFQREAKRLVSLSLPLPAYDFVIKASHAFNMLDAKGVISVSERASYIAQIRETANAVAESYVAFREQLGFPLLLPLSSPAVEKPLPPIIPSTAPIERFLLEIGVEELPAAMLPGAIETLQRAIDQLLEEKALSHGDIRVYGAPRRLAVVVENLATARPASRVEKKGPRKDAMLGANGTTTAAANGFLSGVGLRYDELEVRTIKGIEYVFAAIESPAVSTAEILQEALPKLIAALEFPKSMRWGDHRLSFCRPIRWIAALLGVRVIPFRLEHLVSGRTTQSHRQLKPGPIELLSAKDYEKTLEESFVMVDQQRRRERILSEIEAIERSSRQTAVHKERVVRELTYLSEWPQVVATQFDKSLLDAPKEVLILEMVEHQKYLPLVDADGHLCNQFIMVADNTPTETVQRGNVKVLSARLADGSFLWKEDVKVPLRAMQKKLAHIIYQKELGTVLQKTERLERLVRSLHSRVPAANLEQALLAAQLSKADIASQVVGEFPELQGIVGGLLAKEQGLPSSVAAAIRDHWLPKQEDGPLPSSPEGTLVALADKLDTLAGFFAVGLKPTSSGDPYALRRQAVGLVRILISNGIHLSLRETVAKVFTLFHAERPDLAAELCLFIVTRAKGLFHFRKEALEAVLASQSDDLFDALLRLQALSELQQSASDLAAFVEVVKRCHGQVDLSFVSHIEPKAFEDDVERVVYAALERTEKAFHEYAKAHNWKAALSELLLLREPIEALFSKVKVLADDPVIRTNRLSLLRNMIGLCAEFADVKILARA